MLRGGVREEWMKQLVCMAQVMTISWHGIALEMNWSLGLRSERSQIVKFATKL